MSLKFFAWRSLTTRVTLLTLTILLVSIWSLAFYAGEILHKDIEGLLSDQQFSTATFIADGVNEELVKRIKSIESVALLISPAMQQGNTEILKTLLEQRPIFQTQFNNGTFITGSDGIAIAEFPVASGRIGRNYAAQDFISAILNEGGSTVISPLTDGRPEKPLILMVAPIVASDGKVIGVVAGETDLSKANFLDKITENRYGKTGGYVVIAPRHKLIITGTDKSRIMQPTAASGTNPLLDRYMQGFEGSGIVVDSLGLEVLSSAKQVPAAGWFVVVRIPTLEAFAPIKDMERRTLLLAFFMTLLAGGLTWWVLKRQLAPIHAAVQTMASQQFSSEPPKPLPITRPDEVGKLIGGFNSLLKTLKNREDALTEVKELFTLFVRNSPFYAYIKEITPSGIRVLQASENFQEMVGIPGSKMIGKMMIDLFPAEFAAKIDSDDQAVVATGEVLKIDEELNGRYYSTIKFPLSQGDKDFLAGYTIDITELKRAEQHLRASEGKFRSLTESSPDYIIRYDRSCRYIYMNPAALAATGLSETNIVGKSHGESGFPADLSKFLEKKIAAVFETAEPYQTEFLWQSAKGPLSLDWRLTPEFDSDSRVHTVLGVSRDITAQKRDEEVIRKNEEKFFKVFKASPDAITIASMEDGKYIDVNEIFLQITGFTRDEIIGYTSTEVNVWVDMNNRETFIAQLAKYKFLNNFETQYRMKSGEIRDFSVSSEVIELEQKQCSFNFIKDITESKRMQREKESLQAQLIQAQKLESVGRLAGGVAHDFNNMLAVILGHTELAMEKIDPEQPVFANLQQIHRAADRSASITRQLLAFARKQIVAPKVIDLNETVTGMLKMLLRLIGEDINLAWLPGNRLWSVKIDPTQIDQILANLCVNARDAIGGVGKITVETRNCKLDDQYCTTHPGFVPGEYVQLAVSDNGSGIDQEILSHIFEPFFTTKGVGEGTGLGLATVYGIVKQNEGFINIDSEPGQGTTFTIYLPRHLGATDQEHIDVAEKIALHGDATILLVEDEPTLLHMVREMLQPLGYTVLAAGNPRQAISLADNSTGAIHLLLTDVVMPEMNGRDLANHLRSSFPQLKCLFMSGYTSDIITKQGLLDEGVQFIQKPFSKNDLATKIKIILGKS